jgi:hypothetical protein
MNLDIPRTFSKATFKSRMVTIPFKLTMIGSEVNAIGKCKEDE